MHKLLLLSLISCSRFDNCHSSNGTCREYLDYNYEWDFTVFVNRTLCTFRNELRYTDKELLKCILFYIWECIGNKNRNKLALFVASSLHNTSFYKIFEKKCSNDKYKSRGLIMIQGFENYVYLSNISTNNYVECPDLLAIPRYDTICDTIRFWKDKLRNVYTFENMMESLRIQSWLENRHNDDIENWRHMYKNLKHAYCMY